MDGRKAKSLAVSLRRPSQVGLAPRPPFWSCVHKGLERVRAVDGSRMVVPVVRVVMAIGVWRKNGRVHLSIEFLAHAGGRRELSSRGRCAGSLAVHESRLIRREGGARVAVAMAASLGGGIVGKGIRRRHERVRRSVAQSWARRIRTCGWAAVLQRGRSSSGMAGIAGSPSRRDLAHAERARRMRGQKRRERRGRGGRGGSTPICVSSASGLASAFRGLLTAMHPRRFTREPVAFSR